MTRGWKHKAQLGSLSLLALTLVLMNVRARPELNGVAEPKRAVVEKEEERRVLDVLVQERKAGKRTVTDEAAVASSAQQLAGLRFEPFEQQPMRRLVQHPEWGEVIEITFPNGGVLYQPNDPVFDLTNERLEPRRF